MTGERSIKTRLELLLCVASISSGNSVLLLFSAEGNYKNAEQSNNDHPKTSRSKLNWMNKSKRGYLKRATSFKFTLQGLAPKHVGKGNH